MEPANNRNPLDPLVACLVKGLDVTQREVFEERAGIRQFDGRQEQAEAERWALLEVIEQYQLVLQQRERPDK